MLDFILTALPFVAAGIAIAVLVVHFSKGKKREKKCKDYATEGMSIGMCFGAAFGSLFPEYIGIGLSVGMLIGLVIGMCVKKNEKKGNVDHSQ